MHRRPYPVVLAGLLDGRHLDRRSLGALAAAVDDVDLPDGRLLGRPGPELVVVVAGELAATDDGGLRTVGPVRLLVVGPRELRALREIAPRAFELLVARASVAGPPFWSGSRRPAALSYRGSPDS